MEHISITEFAGKLNEILPMIMREFVRHQSNELVKGKITLPQFLILDILRRESDSTMTHLARVMDVTTAAMTGIVERLVNGGYIARGFDPQDRRIIKIRLTAKGLAVAKDFSHQRTQTIIKVFGKISEQDRLDYLRILTQIRDILGKDASEKG
jgi:DNA-binding MarR family transcriptional regulator